MVRPDQGGTKTLLQVSLVSGQVARRPSANPRMRSIDPDMSAFKKALEVGAFSKRQLLNDGAISKAARRDPPRQFRIIVFEVGDFGHCRVLQLL